MQRLKLRKALFTLHFSIVTSILFTIVSSGYPKSKNLWMMIPIWLGIFLCLLSLIKLHQDKVKIKKTRNVMLISIL